MAVYPDGYIDNGGTYGSYDSFGDGCVFEDTVFIAPCYFGEGCVFVNCRFRCRRRRPWHEVGPAATVYGGSVDCTNFDDHLVMEDTDIRSVNLGNPISVDGGPKEVLGTDVEVTNPPGCFKGAEVAGTAGESSTDWCEHKCDNADLSTTVKGDGAGKVEITDACGKKIYPTQS